MKKHWIRRFNFIQLGDQFYARIGVIKFNTQMFIFLHCEF